MAAMLAKTEASGHLATLTLELEGQRAVNEKQTKELKVAVDGASGSLKGTLGELEDEWNQKVQSFNSFVIAFNEMRERVQSLETELAQVGILESRLFSPRKDLPAFAGEARA